MPGPGVIAPHSPADAQPSAAEAPPYVRALERAWTDALATAAGAHAAGLVDRSYSFAGRPVRLRALGARFGERTVRAFSHLTVTGRDSGGTQTSSLDGRFTGLVIELWDERETGVPMPPDADGGESERSWIACGGTLTASGGGQYVTFRFGDSVTLLDRREQRVIGCRRDGSSLSGGEYSKPLLLMLSIWYYDRGVQLLHAGALARGGAAVLFPGESGTGKSTTCLAAAVQGLQYIGDDFIGLERTPDERLLVHSIYGTGCVIRDNLARFESIRRHVVDEDAPGDEKPILFVPEIFRESVCRTAEIRAVALLSVGHANTVIEPAPRVESLRQFAASTLHTVVPRPGRQALEMVGYLAERTPAYRLMLGPNLEDVAPAIDGILERAATRNA